MKPYFKDEDSAIRYVNSQFERKIRNLICRRVRLTRKVNLQEFNYFVTFTYDGKSIPRRASRRSYKAVSK